MSAITSPVPVDDAAAPVEKIGESQRSKHVAGVPSWLAGLVAFGFAPLIYWHVLQLAQKTHYHFLVVLPIAAIALVRGMDRVDEKSEPQTDFSRASVPFYCLIIALVGLVLATIAWSPWLAAVAAYIAVLPCLWFFRGWQSIRRWAPLWILCVILIPPPFGMDEDLILWLRGHATHMTSAVLDQFGVLHRSYANVIALPQKTLFVADACSGIHSLYVLMGAALFIGLLNRRNALHIGLLLLTTFGLVLIENVTRLTSVAMGFQYQMDLSEGPNHAYLGFLLFGISLLLVLSADQFWRFVLGPNPSFPLLGHRKNRTKKEMPSNEVSGWMRTAMIALPFCFPLLAVAQLFAMPGAPPAVAHLFDDTLTLPDFGPDVAPEEFGLYRRINYERIRRVPGDPFGQESQQWTYSRPDGSQAMISIDFPYDGVHDACKCYTQVGWDIYEQEIKTIPSLNAIDGIDAAVDAPLGFARMRQKLEGQGLLLSSFCDLDGNTAVVLKDLLEKNAGERLAARFGGGGVRDGATIATAGEWNSPPFVQFQLLAKSASDFSEQDVTELMNLYLAVRTELRQQVVESVREGSE